MVLVDKVTAGIRPPLNADPTLAESAAAPDSALLPLTEFSEWYNSRLKAGSYTIQRIPLASLDGWRFESGTGNVVHSTGRFFSVEGLRAEAQHVVHSRWSQPILHQPEVGILGIIVKRMNGIPHFLMHAKMEPGNINTLQLSPTVQATRSNFTRVHKGAPPRYLEYFMLERRGRVIVDTIQSEHGQWFYQKRNRNMIVEVTDEIDVHDDYCWLTLGQIHRLMHRHNLVNMDTRTVLSCLDVHEVWTEADQEVLGWISDLRTAYQLTSRRVPLAELTEWRHANGEIARKDGNAFRIIGVSVEASGREVARWSQPLLAPRGRGVIAFLTRQIDGVDHLLVHARVDPGHLDVVELGPTVQYPPDEGSAPYLADVLLAPPSRIRFDAVFSEEGGRLYHAESRYMIVAAGDETAVREGYRWLPAPAVRGLLRHGHYVNVQARSLLACLT